MANNCLVKKLKGVVQNDDLLKLHELRATFVNNRDYGRVIVLRSINTADFVTLTFSIGVTISNLSSQVIAQNVTSFSMAGNPSVIIAIPANTTITMSVDKKYNIFSLTSNTENSIVYKGVGGLVNLTDMEHEYCPNVQGINIESYKNSKDLIILSFVSSGITGNVSALSSLTALTTLKFRNCTNVTGDANIFADATKFTSLTTLDLRNSGITNRTAEVKALIEAAHPGITVQL